MTPMATSNEPDGLWWTAKLLFIFSGLWRHRSLGSSTWIRFLSVDVLVEAVEVAGLVAVDPRPPVADEMALVEDSPLGTQERVGPSVGLAHVKYLQKNYSLLIGCFYVARLSPSGFELRESSIVIIHNNFHWTTGLPRLSCPPLRNIRKYLDSDLEFPTLKFCLRKNLGFLDFQKFSCC